MTDVDDDILRKARELGVHYLDLAAEEMARFDAEMGLLNLLPVWSEPRATSAISEILSLIGRRLAGGFAYESGGSVYFSVASFGRFGEVSHLDRARMLELAAEHGGRPEDPAKRDPLDFVLWQPSLPDEPAWESRWGPGRPGWHIECSALVLRELGETIDIHGGGRDLVFPHHECETAQSEAVTGVPFVRLWFHVASWGSTAPRCRSRSGTSCSWGTCARSGTRPRCGSRCWRTTIERTGTGRRGWTCRRRRRGWRCGGRVGWVRGRRRWR